MTKSFNPLTAWLASATAMHAAGFTVAVRVTRFYVDLWAGRLDEREARRMVAEKAEAAARGGLAAIAMAPALLTPRTFAETMQVWARIGQAATRPGYATARANARRLSRPRGSRR